MSQTKGPDYWIESHLRHDFRPPPSQTRLPPPGSYPATVYPARRQRRTWRHPGRRLGRRQTVWQARAGAWLLLHLFSRHLLPQRPLEGEARFLRRLAVLLLLLLLLESVLLVLVAQALRS